MPSTIDATKPADGVAAVKAQLRANLATAKTEIDHGGFLGATPTNYSAANDQSASHRAGIDAALGIVQVGVATKQTTFTGPGPLVDAAAFGDSWFLSARLTNAGTVTVTLGANVLTGRILEVVRAGAGNVTVAAQAGATVNKPTSATLITTEQYQSMTFIVDENTTGTAAAWRRVSGPA